VVVEDRPSRTPPAGTKLAEKVIPFSLDFTGPAGGGGLSDLTADGTLTNSVYRTPSGTLAFVYDVFVEPITYDNPTRPRAPVQELSELVAGGYAGFLTDVSGIFDDGSGVFLASRSIDASLVSGRLSNGLARVPYFVIETNATAFDDLGLSAFTAGDEFLVTPENDQVYSQDSAVLVGTFRPVPEPTAAALLIAPALGLLRRRRAMRA
jgi:hypothetical protein